MNDLTEYLKQFNYKLVDYKIYTKYEWGAVRMLSTMLFILKLNHKFYTSILVQFTENKSSVLF